MNNKTSKEASSETFTLTDNRSGRSFQLPILKGTMGPDVVDVRKFYAETKCFTYDPGYTSTGSCDSKITFIDGDKGVLLYRGYPIDVLAEQSDFTEVCYLLLYGDLPTPRTEGEIRKGHYLSHHAA